MNQPPKAVPTYLGTISAVSGSSVSVELAPQLNSGLILIEGKTHRIGQVGSFIRIPQGYNSLYGIISETSETSSLTDENEILTTKRRYIKVELVGETIGDVFERGIGQYPSINDEAHIVTDSDLKAIYGEDTEGQINIGKLASSDSINVSIDLEKLVTRHSAVLGSTGSGKSTSVSSLLRSIVSDDDQDENLIAYPSSRIILIDIHGEYAKALGDISKVFSVTPRDTEEKLVIPYWCLTSDHLIDFLCGNVNDSNRSLIADKILEGKKSLIDTNSNHQNIKSLDLNRITSGTPIPFNLKQVWYELYHDDNVTWNEKEQISPAYESEGDVESLTPPRFKPPATGGNPPYKGNGGKLVRQLELFRSRLLDQQFSFLLSPDEWQPTPNNEIQKDLDELLNEWLGHEMPVTILDLSGIPSASLELLLGSLIDILFESAIWGKNFPEGMKERPLLLVLEEAHRYLSNDSSGLAKTMVQRIAKEGRKFGLGSMLVSQRPSEIDETILSQCGTLFALRINNSSDRNRVKAAMSEGVSGIVDSLPVLRTGEAIITGESAKLPMRCRFKLPRKDRYPDSIDPDVAEKWSSEKGEEDYARLVNAWRNQNPQPNDQ